MKNPWYKEYTTWIRVGTMALLLLFAFISLHLLYSAWCAFTWSKFTLFDYGVYTNMIWNSGHADWFRVLVDDSYLSTHLSFSLALLGGFFYLWDNPFLLSLVQWLMMVSGALILVFVLNKSKSPLWATASVIVFLAGYKYTQGVLLSEFHTVGAYMLLLPWLYYACLYAKRTSWIPLVLILGVREDAFLFVLPMLLYFAVRDRWKGGYILFAVALCYGMLALSVLYPAINGYSLLARRTRDMSGMRGAFFAGKSGICRAQGILWTLLPVLCFAGRRMLPVLVFPSIAVAQCLLSGYATQQSMGSHYGGPVIICLAVGITEVIRTLDLDKKKSNRKMLALRLALLLTVTITFHLREGFILFGGQDYHVYASPSLTGRLALKIAKTLPKEGILVVENSLSGMCANRADLLTLEKYNTNRYAVDVIFGHASNLINDRDGYWMNEIKNGNFGIRYYDGIFMVIERGYDLTKNDGVIKKIAANFCPVVATSGHGGVDRINKDGRLIRYWNGNGSKGPICLSFGNFAELPAGTYEAVFSFRAVTPERKVRDSWGWLSVHFENTSEHLAESMITPSPEMDNQQREQRVKFELADPATVELRITGADARLWLDSMWIMPSADNTIP